MAVHAITIVVIAANLFTVRPRKFYFEDDSARRLSRTTPPVNESIEIFSGRHLLVTPRYRSGLLVRKLSRDGTPLNPGNILKRYVRPIAKELGIQLGGWHDFRHTLTTELLRDRVSAKVVSNILGHKDVKITLDTYCHPEVRDFREPLRFIASQLLPNVMNSELSTRTNID